MIQTVAPAPRSVGGVGAGRRAGTAVAIGLPLLVLAVGAWSRRWTSDDGFINLRIVEQIWAGNGPVWNAAERVETGTSPLWLAAVATFGAVLRFVALEWVSVVLGIVCTVGGLLAASLAARALHGADRRPLVPLAAVVVAAVPAFWDFASSGLETGLSFLWLGLGGWALAAAAVDATAVAGRRRLALTAALLGLGPLVRPDLALVSAGMLLALVALCPRPRLRTTALVVVAAGALPVGYQVFRMAYFAALVPNTAFAKEGGLSRWDAGWAYAGDYVGTWRLWWPAAAVLLVAVASMWRWVSHGEHRRAVAVVGITAGAAVHALYVIRVGGDFMHGRLLLPATFAALLPWAVVPLRTATAAAATALLPWAALAATSWEPPGQPETADGPADGVVDERAYYTSIAGTDHPVTAADFGGGPYASGGRAAAAVADEGEGDLTLRTFTPADRGTWSPLADPTARFAVSVDNIGVFGYLAGTGVTVVDTRGLGDPVTSRFRLEGERGRPGHEKAATPEWVVGRHGAAGTSPPDQDLDDADMAAARDAVGCGALADVLDAISEPLTPSRAAANLALSLRTYDLRFSADPVAARDELCGG